ncbi:MAG: hypothetical protein WDM77_15030 [Steroidobacteraceae bacterium]
MSKTATLSVMCLAFASADVLAGPVSAALPPSQPSHAESDADARFATLEHAYVVYSMSPLPGDGDLSWRLGV